MTIAAVIISMLNKLSQSM